MTETPGAQGEGTTPVGQVQGNGLEPQIPAEVPVITEQIPEQVVEDTQTPESVVEEVETDVTEEVNEEVDTDDTLEEDEDAEDADADFSSPYYFDTKEAYGTVYVQPDAFSEEVFLEVAMLADGTPAYQEAEAALTNAEKEFDGMLAFDIHFRNAAGEEKEPADGARVELNVKQQVFNEVLQDDENVVDIVEESVEINHIVDGTGEVETVAAKDDNTNPDVAVDVTNENTPVAVASDFAVGSFSTFTVTWKVGTEGNSKTHVLYEAYIVDTSGRRINDINTVDILIDKDEPGDGEYSFANTNSNYVPKIEGKVYKGAFFDFRDPNTQFDTISFKKEGSGKNAKQSVVFTFNDENKEAKTLGSADTGVIGSFYLVYGTEEDEEPGYGGPGGHIGTDSSVSLNPRKYTKKLDDQNNPDLYNLTLEITGTSDTITTVPKMDVVFVIDDSYSMNGKGAGNAVDSLVDILNKKPEGDLDARYALVSFQKEATKYGWMDASEIKDVTKNLGKAKAGAGTNIQQGIRYAKELLNESRPDAETFVILLSDGDANYYMTKRNEKNGDFYHEDVKRTSRDSAKIEIGNLYCSHIYGVDYGTKPEEHKPEEYKLDEFVLSGAASPYTIYTTNIYDLRSKFQDIGKIMSEMFVTKVVIEDSFSEYAEPVLDAETGEYVGEITVKDKYEKNIHEKNDDGSVTVGGKKITADVDENGIKMVFEADYQLNPEYTYAVTVKIKPTEAAYQYYEENNAYPPPDKEKGFHSNNDATVTYMYNGRERKQPFENPFIQVTPRGGTLEITKVVEGVDTAFSPQSYTFTVTGEGSNEVGNVTIVGSGTATISKLDANKTYTVTETAESVNGYSMTTSYVIGDAQQPSVGKEANDITITNGGTTKVVFTNTYTKNLSEIKVTKEWVDNGNEKKTRPELITVNLHASNSKEPVSTAEITENKETGEWTHTFKQNGGFPLVDENGDEITYTVSEEPVPGYTNEGENGADITGSASVGFTITNTLIGVHEDHYEGETENAIGKLVIKKVDSKDANKTLNGATFTLTKEDTNAGTTSGNEADTKTTEEAGVVEFLFKEDPEKAEGGVLTYTLTETTPPEEYKKPDTASWTVTVKRGELKESEFKEDAENPSSGTWHYTYALDVSVKGLGFDEDSGSDVFIVKNTEQVDIQDIYLPVTMNLRKVGIPRGKEAPEGLGGAVFQLLKEGEEGQDPTVVEGYNIIFSSSEEPVGSLPELKFSEPGTYILKETQAPEQFMIDGNGEYTIQVEPDGKAELKYDAEAGVWYNEYKLKATIDGIQNDSIRNTAIIEEKTVYTDPGQLVILKQGPALEGGTEKPRLPGAEFTLYEKEEVVGTITTSEEGEKGVGTFDFTQDHVPTDVSTPRTFTLKETKAPEGYLMSNTAYTVIIAVDGSSDPIEEWVSKEDAEELNPEYEGNGYWELTYELVMTVKNEAGYEVSLNDDNQLEITNEPIQETEISITKVWDDNNDELQKRPDSVLFTLKNGDLVVSEVSLTSNNAVPDPANNNTWSGVFPREVPATDAEEKPIEYTVEEAPLMAADNGTRVQVKGYKAPVYGTHTIDETEVITGFTVTNSIHGDDIVITKDDEGYIGTIEFKKIDADTDEPLPGAEFAIISTDSEGRETVIATGTSDADGKVQIRFTADDLGEAKVERLKADETVQLTLRETAAPDGYLFYNEQTSTWPISLSLSDELNAEKTYFDEDNNTWMKHYDLVINGTPKEVTNSWNSSIMIQTPDVSMTYNGEDIYSDKATEMRNNGKALEGEGYGKLRPGHSIVLSYDDGRAAVTDVTESPVPYLPTFDNDASKWTGVKIVDKDQNDVTALYSIAGVLQGTITIHPRPVTVTVRHEEKVYGNADPAYRVDIEGTLTEADKNEIQYETFRDKWVADYPGSLQDNWNRLEGVGEKALYVYAPGKAHTRELKSDHPDKQSRQGNYIVSYRNNTLSVIPREITVTLGEKEVTIDELQKLPDRILRLDPDKDVTVSGLAKGGIDEGFDYVKQIHIKAGLDKVGELPVTGDDVVYLEIRRNPDVTKNYKVNYVPGKLKVTPAPAPESTPTPVPTPAPVYIYVPGQSTTTYVYTPAPAAAPAVAAPAVEGAVLGVRRGVTVDPVTDGDGAAVLGVRRNTGQDGPAVLGSRRGETGDESLMFNYLVILMALVLLTQLYVGDKRRVRK